LIAWPVGARAQQTAMPVIAPIVPQSLLQRADEVIE
jgi:hypothetical protein